MAKVEVKTMIEQKKILPLVMTLANSIIKQLGLVEKINESVEWDKAHWGVSPGDLAKILILSTFFDVRIALIHLERRFDGIDLSFFLSKDSKSSDVNSFNAGRALDRIGEIDYNGLYETMALSAIQLNRIPTERLHADTTTISFYGQYDTDTLNLSEEERKELLQIERGYNKDGRPQCKQVVVGQIVNEVGIPIASRTMDGATSDVEWNVVAVSYLKELQSTGFQYGIFVADSKLVTHDLIVSMNAEENRIPFVSRCPANFEGKLENRTIQRAYGCESWEEIGVFHTGKDASTYRGQSFVEEICGQPMRLLVLESSSLKGKAGQILVKAQESIEPFKKSLEKKVFLCIADAEEEVQRFKKMTCLKLFDCDCEIDKETVELWPRGRRGAGSKPTLSEKYRIQVKQIRQKEEKCREVLQSQSCIVLISNVVDGPDDRELLKIYKGQQVVENSFRRLKSPSLASVIYLKNQTRIQALSMLLTLSLLIRAIIQYRLREGLKEFEQDNPGVKLKVGWGNIPLKNPTYHLLYEHAINCYFEKEGLDKYSFTWPTLKTKIEIEPLLMLLGIELYELLD